MNRRDALKLMGAAAVGTTLGTSMDALSKGQKKPANGSMPAIFAAHGNPMVFEDAVFVGELNHWAQVLPRPKAVLMISAHWTEEPMQIGATRTVPLVYDFYGFPEKYYQVRYPAPGAPELAERVRTLMKKAGMAVGEAPDRGLDHGAYIPLMCMYPNADVPVLQISLPSMNPQELFEVGMALAPLREEGVLLFGSGFLTHNLRMGDFRPDAPTPPWASDFDAWVEHAVSRRDFDALLDYRNKAPGVRIALPTHEHFVPVIVAAGASSGRADAVQYPITGYMYGSFTKRSVQFG
jgi:4,5-DOPA dioxygenase extradiol